MATNVAETAIGGVVLAAAVGFFLYAANSADVALGGSDYPLVASFRKADGVTPGGDVRISGVKVGSVSDVSLDQETYQARVELSIRNGVDIPDDSSAVVATEGILGGTHIAIQPGGSDTMLQPGEAFDFTQGSINLLDLVGRFISGSGATSE